MIRKTIIIGVCWIAVAACGKHNALAPPGVATSIVFYDAGQHRVSIDSFTYNGGQLTDYTNQIIDSAFQNGYELQSEVETEVYHFQYQGGQVVPVAVTITDTMKGIAYTRPVFGWSASYDLGYDGQGRLTYDSLTSSTDTSACCGSVTLFTWEYSDSGFSIYLLYHSSGPNLFHTILLEGGNANPGGMKFSSVRNPLYNPAFEGNLGSFFFGGEASSYLGWQPIGIDFLSKNLPASGVAPYQDDQLIFTWQLALNERVLGGTVRDTLGEFGPVNIKINYQ